MRFQLAVFSLVVLLLYFEWLLASALALRGGPRRPMARGRGAAAEGLASLAEEALRDTLVSYVLFAAVALVMFSLGKPGLFAQWAGWGVVGFQVLRIGALPLGWSRWRSLFGAVVLALLTYLWVLQLPFFDRPPA